MKLALLLTLVTTICVAQKSETYRYNGETITKSPLVKDNNGVTIFLGVLRYNSEVIDIAPFTRSLLNDEYEFRRGTMLSLKFKSDLLKQDHVIELVSKYKFELKDDHLSKHFYTGINKNDFPQYLTLTIESLTLK
ncbi:hypothetical protein DYU11_11760 [Fibrisoma montanum]|uniref:Uncharacterized protein n=1 Tax=Fibrisoma montanum TaxID=2305895 RepID=A0A418MBC9_9BACT|nr:hypothetical protein [Fibrisoma montanum]RIV23650.1 hypothetical protein DYU11_11760 [Fibrisoma montanum]